MRTAGRLGGFGSCGCPSRRVAGAKSLSYYYVSRDAKCILVTAVCVSICLSLSAFPHYCAHPGASSGNGRVCSLVLHYWADLQSVHRFRCYDNVAPNAKCQQVLVLAVYLVVKRVAAQCMNFNRSSFVCLRTALSPCREHQLAVTMPVCMCASLNDMTFDLNICRSGSS